MFDTNSNCGLISTAAVFGFPLTPLTIKSMRPYFRGPLRPRKTASMTPLPLLRPYRLHGAPPVPLSAPSRACNCASNCLPVPLQPGLYRAPAVGLTYAWVVPCGCPCGHWRSCGPKRNDVPHFF